MSDIYAGMKEGRRIDGWTLVSHPMGLAIVKNGETCGVVEINEFPQYHAGYKAIVKAPELSPAGWMWKMDGDSPLCSSVRQAVQWAIEKAPRAKVGKGNGVFAEYSAIVNPEYSWK